MYRRRIRQSRKREHRMEQMRAEKERQRLDGDPSPPVWVPPAVRRRVIVEDYDFGTVRHELVLYRAGRIDSYQLMADGRMVPGLKGWSAVCELLRKTFVRVGNFD